VKFDAFGDPVAATGQASASFHSDSSFLAAYSPPGEVQSLAFTGKTSLHWSPEQSVGHYEVYRDLLAALPANGFGGCLASGLTATTVSEPATPAIGQGWFYLVTARNRLDEEGTKGKKSNGSQRPNPAPCP
jgi:hypothetical protein